MNYTFKSEANLTVPKLSKYLLSKKEGVGAIWIIFWFNQNYNLLNILFLTNFLNKNCNGGTFGQQRQFWTALNFKKTYFFNKNLF